MTTFILTTQQWQQFKITNIIQLFVFGKATCSVFKLRNCGNNWPVSSRRTIKSYCNY